MLVENYSKHVWKPNTWVAPCNTHGGQFTSWGFGSEENREIDSESQPDQLEVDPDEAAHIQQQYEDHLAQQNDQDAFDFEQFYSSGYQGMFWDDLDGN